MQQVVIENPVINSPFQEPKRHFRFTEDGITDEIACWFTEAGLTPVASTKIAAPGYAEAELILECRKIYWDDVHPEHFLDLEIDANYPHKDYHRIYFGEILYMLGDEKFGKD